MEDMEKILNSVRTEILINNRDQKIHNDYMNKIWSKDIKSIDEEVRGISKDVKDLSVAVSDVEKNLSKKTSTLSTTTAIMLAFIGLDF